MASKTTDKIIEVLKAVAPLVGVVCLLQVTLVHAPLELFLQFLAGAVLAGTGMLLLLLGVDLGILPMGRFIGAELPKKNSVGLIVAVSFSLGFATTVAEPDVLVLAGQVDQASQGSISGMAVLYVIAIGVAILTVIASVCILFGWSIKSLVLGAYGSTGRIRSARLRCRQRHHRGSYRAGVDIDCHGPELGPGRPLRRR